MPGGNRISEWPSGERPRELLEQRGAEHLTEAQLLALILRTGSSGPPTSALELGRCVRSRYPTFADLDRATFAELRRVRGLGCAKTASLKAALEIGRRFMAEAANPQRRFTSSREVAGYFTPMLSHLPKEVFVAVLLNGRNELIRETTVAVGSLTCSLVHPREVFHPAVRDSAAAVIFVHNHPSGDPSPSTEDRRLTSRLVKAGEILGIRVLDHVVVARRGYVSLLGEGTGAPH